MKKWLDRWALKRIRGRTHELEDALSYMADRLGNDLKYTTEPLVALALSVSNELEQIARVLKLQGPFAWRAVIEAPGMLQNARCIGCREMFQTLDMLAATNVATGEGYLYCQSDAASLSAKEGWLKSVPRSTDALL